MSFNENLNAFMLGQRLRPGLMGVKTPPTLKPKWDWYPRRVDEGEGRTFSRMHIVDSYIPNGTETRSWAADVGDAGDIMCYTVGDTFIIAGNGSGKIMANEDSDYLFAGFYNLTELNGLSLLDTSKAQRFYNAFCFHQLETLDVSGFDTSSAISLAGMFSDCLKLKTLDLRNFNTTKVTNMINMFSYCYELESIDLSSFDTSNVTSMHAMFRNCWSLSSLDLSGFNTSNVTNMARMFMMTYDEGDKGDGSMTELDLTSFDTSSVTDFMQMFAWNKSLTKVLVSDKWVVDASDRVNLMFDDCQISSVTYV